MAKTYHLKCPSCGGLLSARGERVLSCKYCGERSLVIIPDYMPSYYLRPRIDYPGARRAMVNLFKAAEVETGMLKTAHFESAELFFVPLYHLRARRVGTLLLKPHIEADYVQSAREERNLMASAIYSSEYKMLQAKESAKPDTKVILSDVNRGMPAINLEEWGVEDLDPEKVMIDLKSEYRNYNREELDKLGSVLEPTISCSERIDQIFKTDAYMKNNDNTEIVDQRVDLVYYPVWRVRWKYQNKAYLTTIDALSGKIMFARAPTKQRARVLWLLGVAASVGISLGGILRVLKYILLTGAVGMWFFMIFFTVFFFFVAFGWNMFRYSSEIIFRGDEISYEWIGRPPATFFDKIAEKWTDYMNVFFQQNRGSRWGSG